MLITQIEVRTSLIHFGFFIGLLCDILAVKEMRCRTRVTPSSVWMMKTQDWLKTVRHGQMMISGDMSVIMLERIVRTTTQHLWPIVIIGFLLLTKECAMIILATTCLLETFGKFMSVEIHILAITLY